MNTKREWQRYRGFRRAAERGAREEAERGLAELLEREGLEPALAALCHNDLGVLLAARGEAAMAADEFHHALELAPELAAARANLARLRVAVPASPPDPAKQETQARSDSGGKRLAIVSLLFNWPAHGGGCMHTVGFGTAFAAEGWEVRHFFAREEQFGVGRMEAPYPLQSECLEFDASTWQRARILGHFREAVDRFVPDLVLVTDAWNLKPHLVEALQAYPVLMRFDSQECLCPLNNCRFLARPDGGFTHCGYHQMATPEICRRCLAERGHLSGPLHQAERELSGVLEEGYPALLRRSLASAAAVLVNNPLLEATLSPYAPRVKAIPPGVEARRFPRLGAATDRPAASGRSIIFMAGTIGEPFKGFSILHRACSLLWQKRRDFRLVATGEPAGQVDEFTSFTGWLSQEELPVHYWAADICVVPSLVQDAWPNVAVEAMAAGRPVVASRVGGLQFIVGDGGNGFLYEPGDPAGLAERLAVLLDQPELRQSMGRRAREWYERHGRWEALMARCYRPLLGEVFSPTEQL